MTPLADYNLSEQEPTDSARLRNFRRQRGYSGKYWRVAITAYFVGKVVENCKRDIKTNLLNGKFI